VKGLQLYIQHFLSNVVTNSRATILWVEGGIFWFLPLFPWCSMEFSSGSQSSQVVLQGIPNSTQIYSIWFAPSSTYLLNELVQFQPMFWWIGSILTWLDFKRGKNNSLILNQRKGMNLKIIHQQHQSTSCKWQDYITILNIRNSSFHHICSFTFKSLKFIQNVTYDQIL